jgi:hypothetical protein
MGLQFESGISPVVIIILAEVFEGTVPSNFMFPLP